MFFFSTKIPIIFLFSICDYCAPGYIFNVVSVDRTLKKKYARENYTPKSPPCPPLDSVLTVTVVAFFRFSIGYDARARGARY